MIVGPAGDKLLDHLSERLPYLQLCDRYRLRPDAWMKLEVLRALGDLAQDGTVRELRPDHQGCDVSMVVEGAEWWLAVRSLLTSYAGAGRGARTTIASVEEVAREIDKVRGLATLSGG